MEYQSSETAYFEYSGEINTPALLLLARRRCEQRQIKHVVIASETGRSALAALAVFKDCEACLVVVTHPPATTWGPRGDIPIGLQRQEYAQARQELIEHGVTIIQGTRPFVPPSRSLGWNNQTSEAMIDKTLELFGAGVKIAVETTVMAADGGAVEEGEEVIACGGTFKGLDTALVVRAAFSMNFYKEFEVREIIAKPRCCLHSLPEYENPSWRGELDKYYKK